MADEPLTKEQLEICRRDFDALAPDGTMGKREVSKLLSRQLEREPTPLELDAVLNEMARLSEHHGSVYTAGTAFTFETYVNCLFGHAMEAGSDPAYSKRIAGPIFQEYLQLLNVEENIQGGLMELSSTDCLLVIDMQNDFLSAMPDNPIEAPPFAATESEHVVEPICELMKTFHNVGGLVIATKDYHPWDHCSFMGRGDDYPQQPNYPPHCVQGSQGSKLYSPICATLCELMRSDASRAKIAWKGFHEKVDSFGGAMYPEDSEGNGRFHAAYGKSACQMSCWTGAFVLKSSMMAQMVNAGQPLEAKHVDAPPDVRAVQNKVALHDVVGQAGIKRVFVCGLVLDCCVVDTCLNMLKMGYDEVYMVLDSTRPAHVGGFGQFGTGFLFDPVPVGQWIRDAQMKLVLSAALLSIPSMQALSHRGAPIQSSRPDNAPAAKIKDEQNCMYLKLVRASLVSMSMKVERIPTGTEGGCYTLEKMQMGGKLTDLVGLVPNGLLSPMSPVTLDKDSERLRTDLPTGSTKFCYAHPIDGSERILELMQKAKMSPQILNDKNCAFMFFGGFVYFDEGNEVLGCTARCAVHPGGAEVKEELKLKCKDPTFNDPELLSQLTKRFHPVMPYGTSNGHDQVAGGASSMAWVIPHEGIHPRNRKGGFVLQFDDARPPKWFFL